MSDGPNRSRRGPSTTSSHLGLLRCPDSCNDGIGVLCSEQLYQINTWQVRLFEANILIVLEVVGQDTAMFDMGE